MDFILEYWKQIAVGLLIVVLVGGGAYLGHEYTAAKAEAEAATLAAAQAKATLETTQAARAKEQSKAVDQSVIEQKYQEGLQDGKSETQDAINRLNARNNQLAVSLQQSKAAAARASGENLSSASSCPSQCNGEARSGFSETHGADALRLAGEADDIARQLAACQQVITNDRK